MTERRALTGIAFLIAGTALAAGPDVHGPCKTAYHSFTREEKSFSLYQRAQATIFEEMVAARTVPELKRLYAAWKKTDATFFHDVDTTRAAINACKAQTRPLTTDELLLLYDHIRATEKEANYLEQQYLREIAASHSDDPYHTPELAREMLRELLVDPRPE